MDRMLSSVAVAGSAIVSRDAFESLLAMRSDGVSAALADHQGRQVRATGALAGATGLGVLGSALLVASDGLVREAGGRGCDHTLVIAAEQHIVTMPVGDVAGHALVVVAPRQLVLGKVLWAARRCCDALRSTEPSTRREGDHLETQR